MLMKALAFLGSSGGAALPEEVQQNQCQQAGLLAAVGVLLAPPPRQVYADSKQELQ